MKELQSMTIETKREVADADLVEKGSAAADTRVIEDNLDQRELGPFAKARRAAAQKKQGRMWGLSPKEEKQLLDQIGQLARKRGRNLERFMRVLRKTPIEVQDAVDAGRLPITLAEKVGGLATPKREQLAAEIKAGQDPRQVVRRFIGKGSGKHKEEWPALRTYFRNLEKSLHDLDGRDLIFELKDEHLALLKRADALNERIRNGAAEGARRVSEFAQEREQLLREFADASRN